MGECRGATPHCRGRGGVPHKHTGRVGGKNYVRQAQSRKGLQRGEPPTETQRQLPIAPSPRHPLHWLYASFMRRPPVVPAKAGTSHPCLLCGCRGGSRTARTSRHPKRIPNPATTAHCAIAAPALHWLHTSFTRHTRGHPSFPRKREPRITRRSYPSFPRRPCLLVWDVGAVREPPEGHAIPNVSPNPTTTAHCAIAAPAPTLVVCVIHAPSTRRPREGGNLASLPSVPSFQRRLESRRVRVRTTGNATKCNQMQLN